MSCSRPNRSDVHLSMEEEAKIADETRGYFDGLAPKRHTKPQRSEYSSGYVDALSNSEPNNSTPELSRFQHLESDSQKLIYNASEATEDYAETEYYKDLNCIDKQHHTTGTGFIRVNSANNKNGFSLAPDSASDRHSSCKANPATNDWIPAADDTVVMASEKPVRKR